MATEGPAEDDGDTEPGDDEDSGTTTGDTDDPSVGTDAPVEDVPARGIAISGVDANPGVAIPVVVDGAWVEGL